VGVVEAPGVGVFVGVCVCVAVLLGVTPGVGVCV